MLTLEYAKKVSNNKCCDDNGVCFFALRAAIYQLETKYDYCDEFSDELKLQGYKYIISQIEFLHETNKELLDYDWQKDFTEDEITEQVNACSYVYINSFKEDPNILDSYEYNEELGFFINKDNGYMVNDDEILESEECRDWALGDLLEEYNQEHPNGYEVYNRLRSLTIKCEQSAAKINDKLEFIKTIQSQENIQQSTFTLSDLIIKEKQKVLSFIDSELQACKRPQGKLIAMIIITLCEKGYLPHYSGKLTEIYSAFKQLYPNKVGTPRGIEDYIRGYYKPNDNNPKTISNNELEAFKNKLI